MPNKRSWSADGAGSSAPTPFVDCPACGQPVASYALRDHVGSRGCSTSALSLAHAAAPALQPTAKKGRHAPPTNAQQRTLSFAVAPRRAKEASDVVVLDGDEEPNPVAALVGAPSPSASSPRGAASALSRLLKWQEGAAPGRPVGVALAEGSASLPGLVVIENFLEPAEADAILKEIENGPPAWGPGLAGLSANKQ